MKTISTTEFNKKVEMEFDYLVYTERMKEKEARQKAYDTISSEYQTE